MIDSFGYHLITSYGAITPLNRNELARYRVDETNPLVAGQYQTQLHDMAKKGIYLSFSTPASGGALIAACDASQAEKILDAAFHVQALDRTPRLADRVAQRTDGLKRDVMESFGFAAAGQFVPLPLAKDFYGAAKPANLTSAPVPATIFEDNMRCAA